MIEIGFGLMKYGGFPTYIDDLETISCCRKWFQDVCLLFTLANSGSLKRYRINWWK